MLGGERIADRVLTALRGATSEQLVVANDPAASQWFAGVPIVPDDEPGLGPLAGLATALRAAGGRDVLVAAWDMPFVTAELLGELRRRGEEGASVVVPMHGVEHRMEPLCAWYAARALEPCLALLAAGSRRAGALFETLPGASTLAGAALARFGDQARLFTSVDSPAKLVEQ